MYGSRMCRTLGGSGEGAIVGLWWEADERLEAVGSRACSQGVVDMTHPGARRLESGPKR